MMANGDITFKAKIQCLIGDITFKAKIQTLIGDIIFKAKSWYLVGDITFKCKIGNSLVTSLLNQKLIFKVDITFQSKD